MWKGKFTIYNGDWFSITLFVEHKNEGSKLFLAGDVFDFDSRGFGVGFSCS